ncbi:MAG: SDR family oxidoreductase [Phycisphaerae bacterium]|jgi:3-oxoacyl-[acyl-carrier protein] reductase
MNAPATHFTGKTVLVTGSTQNLGHTIAAEFARAGARVVIHGISQEEAELACEALLVTLPEAALEAQGFDLGDEAGIDAGFCHLKQRGLMPDVLVNNAAHLGLGNSEFLEQTPEFFRQVVEVNLFAPFRCSQLAAMEMKKRGGGAIINISSLAGERSIWRHSAYSTSKAALDGLTRGMALELAPLGIRVNAIAPGYVWTPRWEQLPPGTEHRRKTNTPAVNPTAQEEIAHLALFLASDAAPTLVGARLVIDGGLGIQQVPRDVAV